MSSVYQRKRLFWLNLITLGPLATVTAAGFAGRLWWGFDLFSHFRLQYAAGALLVCLILLIARSGRAAWIALALGVINVAPVVASQMPRTRAPVLESGASKLAATQRVMMMNVYVGNPQIQQIIKYVRKENPDVLVLLEVTDAWVEPLKKLEARYPFRWVHPGRELDGLAVFSRSMPTETRVIDLGAVGRPSFLLTLELGPAPKQKLSILGAHLSPPAGARAAQERDRQLASLAQVAREHTWPLAIVGDFNITPFSPIFTRALRDGDLKNCGSGLHATWPAWAPPLSIQIDHCLATPDVRATDFRVGSTLGSDHHAITVRLSPAPQ